MRIATIFDIQRFSLHDGPGIRTTVFFKGCPLSCIWCQNPESHQIQNEIAFYFENCRHCMECEKVCPHGAILHEDVHHEQKNRVHYEKYNVCGKCVVSCPHQALRLIGQPWGVDPLVQELLKDRAFFEESGGGVTLSGGEPMMWAEFLALLLPKLKKEGLHITIETAGIFPWPKMESILSFLDLIYFDLKLISSKAHKEYTNADNQVILKNFSLLTQSPVRLQPRMAVIPHINDTAENIKATACLLKTHKLTSLHLLPYHNLGDAKLKRIHYHQMHRPREKISNSLTPRNLIPTKALFEQEGIDAVIPE